MRGITFVLFVIKAFFNGILWKSIWEFTQVKNLILAISAMHLFHNLDHTPLIWKPTMMRITALFRLKSKKSCVIHNYVIFCVLTVFLRTCCGLIATNCTKFALLNKTQLLCYSIFINIQVIIIYKYTHNVSSKQRLCTFTLILCLCYTKVWSKSGDGTVFFSKCKVFACEPN